MASSAEVPAANSEHHRAAHHRAGNTTHVMTCMRVEADDSDSGAEERSQTAALRPPTSFAAHAGSKHERQSSDAALPDAAVKRARWDSIDSDPLLTLFAALLGHDDYTAVSIRASASVAELKDAIVAKLQLRHAAHTVRLRLVLDDATAAYSDRLDERRRVQDVGITAHCSVILELRPTGNVPCPHPSLPVPPRVWRTLPQRVQEDALRCHDTRVQLARLRTLGQLHEAHDGAAWPLPEEDIMYRGASGTRLAAVRLPSIPGLLVGSPKGFSLTSPTDLLLEDTRVRLAADFVRAMRDPSSTNYGVLLSGPNGVGKTAVGLLTFLACYAQRLPVVYIPDTASWTVHVADVSSGPLYLLQQFMTQNADLILAHERLRELFLPTFRGEVELCASLLERLAKESLLELPRVGVILDEVQNITTQAEASPTLPCGDYFRQTWYRWYTSTTSAFVRMDIASSHDLRELSLPDGEAARLRFVGPWPLDTTSEFLSHAASPGYLLTADAREHAVYVGGGVVRALLKFKTFLGGDHSSSRLKYAEQRLREIMEASCTRWLCDDLKTDVERQQACKVLRMIVQQRSACVRGSGVCVALCHIACSFDARDAADVAPDGVSSGLRAGESAAYSA